MSAWVDRFNAWHAAHPGLGFAVVWAVALGILLAVGGLVLLAAAWL
jgi:hypothetical protein